MLFQKTKSRAQRAKKGANVHFVIPDRKRPSSVISFSLLFNARFLGYFYVNRRLILRSQFLSSLELRVTADDLKALFYYSTGWQLSAVPLNWFFDEHAKKGKCQAYRKTFLKADVLSAGADSVWAIAFRLLDCPCTYSAGPLVATLSSSIYPLQQTLASLQWNASHARLKTIFSYRSAWIPILFLIAHNAVYQKALSAANADAMRPLREDSAVDTRRSNTDALASVAGIVHSLKRVVPAIDSALAALLCS